MSARVSVIERFFDATAKVDETGLNLTHVVCLPSRAHQLVFADLCSWLHAMRPLATTHKR